jgi:U3 small nucleolar RNA-associated protein 13
VTVETFISFFLLSLFFSLCKTRGWIGAVTVDRSLLFYDLETFERRKQIVGTNDEIIDLRFLGALDSHIAVASSSESIRVYDLATLDCNIVFGHTDIIICMDTNKDGSVLVTGSKDRQARVWKFDSTNPKL